MNIIEQYKFNKIRYKILELDIEAYENDYINLGSTEERLNILKSLKDEYVTILNFISAFDNAYDLLTDEEKIYIKERYYNEKTQKDIALFYLENYSEIPIISPYKGSYNRPLRLITLTNYLTKFNRNIIKKLERIN